MSPQVHAGFTGTQEGMTLEQAAVVARLLQELRITHAHHGDCVGADEQFDSICRSLRIWLIVHPPEDPKKRANCDGPFHEVLPPRPYLDRNSDIVRTADVVIATPRNDVFPGPKNLRGEGTWSTVYRAFKAGRRIIVVTPDGIAADFVYSTGG